MNPGELKHRLIFQANSGGSPGDDGAIPNAYTTQFTVWGKIAQPAVTPEVYEGERLAPTQQAEITIRNRPGVNAGLRVLHKRAGSTLAAGINSAVTALTLNEALAFELGPDDYLLIENEIVRVTAGGGTTSLTVERGVIGTTAASHSTSVVATRVQAYEILGVDTASQFDGLIRLTARRVG